jgi:hypothetical protein
MENKSYGDKQWLWKENVLCFIYTVGME